MDARPESFLDEEYILEAKDKEEGEDEDEFELEQSFDRAEFTSLIGRLLDSLGNAKDLELNLEGTKVHIAHAALHRAEFEVEYEEEGDECELELKIEWKKLVP